MSWSKRSWRNISITLIDRVVSAVRPVLHQLDLLICLMEGYTSARNPQNFLSGNAVTMHSLESGSVRSATHFFSVK
jgi:hypothetical protein